MRISVARVGGILLCLTMTCAGAVRGQVAEPLAPRALPLRLQAPASGPDAVPTYRELRGEVSPPSAGATIGRGALIGALVGLGAGLFVEVTCTDQECPATDLTFLVTVPAGTVLGTLAGIVVAAGR